MLPDLFLNLLIDPNQPPVDPTINWHEPLVSNQSTSSPVFGSYDAGKMLARLTRGNPQEINSLVGSLNKLTQAMGEFLEPSNVGIQWVNELQGKMSAEGLSPNTLNNADRGVLAFIANAVLNLDTSRTPFEFSEIFRLGKPSPHGPIYFSFDLPPATILVDSPNGRVPVEVKLFTAQEVRWLMNNNPMWKKAFSPNVFNIIFDFTANRDGLFVVLKDNQPIMFSVGVFSSNASSNPYLSVVSSNKDEQESLTKLQRATVLGMGLYFERHGLLDRLPVDSPIATTMWGWLTNSLLRDAGLQPRHEADVLTGLTVADMKALLASARARGLIVTEEYKTPPSNPSVNGFLENLRQSPSGAYGALARIFATEREPFGAEPVAENFLRNWLSDRVTAFTKKIHGTLPHLPSSFFDGAPADVDTWDGTEFGVTTRRDTDLARQARSLFEKLNSRLPLLPDELTDEERLFLLDQARTLNASRKGSINLGCYFRLGPTRLDGPRYFSHLFKPVVVMAKRGNENVSLEIRLLTDAEVQENLKGKNVGEFAKKAYRGYLLQNSFVFMAYEGNELVAFSLNTVHSNTPNGVYFLGELTSKNPRAGLKNVSHAFALARIAYLRQHGLWQSDSSTRVVIGNVVPKLLELWLEFSGTSKEPTTYMALNQADADAMYEAAIRKEVMPPQSKLTATDISRMLGANAQALGPRASLETLVGDPQTVLREGIERAYYEQARAKAVGNIERHFFEERGGMERERK